MVALREKDVNRNCVEGGRRRSGRPKTTQGVGERYRGRCLAFNMDGLLMSFGATRVSVEGQHKRPRLEWFP